MDQKKEFWARFTLEVDRPRILRRIARIVGPDEAEDVFQEACLNAWKGYAAFEPTGSFGGWFYTIAYHSCLSRVRRAKRKSFILTENMEEFAQREEPEPSSEEAIEDRVDELGIWRALDILRERSPMYAEAFELHHKHGLTYAEVAGMVRSSVGTVGTRVHRAKLALRSICRQQLDLEKKTGGGETNMAQEEEGVRLLGERATRSRMYETLWGWGRVKPGRVSRFLDIPDRKALSSRLAAAAKVSPEEASAYIDWLRTSEMVEPGERGVALLQAPSGGESGGKNLPPPSQPKQGPTCLGAWKYLFGPSGNTKFVANPAVVLMGKFEIERGMAVQLIQRLVDDGAARWEPGGDPRLIMLRPVSKGVAHVRADGSLYVPAGSTPPSDESDDGSEHDPDEKPASDRRRVIYLTPWERPLWEHLLTQTKRALRGIKWYVSRAPIVDLSPEACPMIHGPLARAEAIRRFVGAGLILATQKPDQYRLAIHPARVHVVDVPRRGVKQMTEPRIVEIRKLEEAFFPPEQERSAAFEAWAKEHIKTAKPSSASVMLVGYLRDNWTAGFGIVYRHADRYWVAMPGLEAFDFEALPEGRFRGTVRPGKVPADAVVESSDVDASDADSDADTDTDSADDESAGTGVTEGDEARRDPSSSDGEDESADSGSASFVSAVMREGENVVAVPRALFERLLDGLDERIRQVEARQAELLARQAELRPIWHALTASIEATDRQLEDLRALRQLRGDRGE